MKSRVGAGMAALGLYGYSKYEKKLDINLELKKVTREDEKVLSAKLSLSLFNSPQQMVQNNQDVMLTRSSPTPLSRE